MRNFRHRRGRDLFEVFAALLIASGSAAGWVSDGSIFLLARRSSPRSMALFAR